MPLSRQQQIKLVTFAGRAPSPHNIQPARWRFRGETVELWEDVARWLSVGDPSGRDNCVALGMAWEGMTIALSGERLRLTLETQTTLDYPPTRSGLRLVARGQISTEATPDLLLLSLNTRSSYRGCFARANSEQLRKLDTSIALYNDIALTLPDSAMSQIATWYDLAAAEGIAIPDFAEELYRWMRFSPRNPQWVRDGLDADCMALSKFEGWGASIALKPAVVKVLTSLSLTRFLVSEADKVKSAARLVLIHTSVDTGAFDAGRAWYRFWLALDHAGFSGVPMSALADSPGYSKKLLDTWLLPHGRKLINVMRLGPIPAAKSARSARLPVAELLLD